MGRLTFFEKGQWWIRLDGTRYGGFKEVERLAAYEDTGLEPEEVSEYQRLCDSYVKAGLDAKFVQFCIDATQNGLSMDRIRELAQAEKDGRLVVLPCKSHESIFYLEDGELFDDEPYEVSLGQKSGEWNDSLMFECQYGFGFFGEDVGKTVFLTREEAEAALKKREEADNEGK